MLRLGQQGGGGKASAVTLLGPAFFLLGTVALVPFLIVLCVSFTEMSAIEGVWKPEWQGLGNYRRFGEDGELVGAAVRTFGFALLAVALELVLGIIFGELFYRTRRKSALSLLGILMPLSLAPVVIGLMWRLMYQGEFGILSLLFKFLGFFRATSITSNHSTAMGALVVVDVWQWTPLVVLVYLGVRRALEAGPIEAARLDGASELAVARDVVFPTAAGVLLACTLLRFVDALREFDKVFILTGGGPGSATEIASLYIWRTAFRNWSFGYASALGVTFYILCFFLSWVFLLVTARGIRRLRVNRGD